MPTFGKDDPDQKFVKDIAKIAMRHKSVSDLGFDAKWGDPKIKVDRSRLKSERHILIYSIDVKLKNDDVVWITVKIRRSIKSSKNAARWIPVSCTIGSKRHSDERRKFTYEEVDDQIVAIPKR